MSNFELLPVHLTLGWAIGAVETSVEILVEILANKMAEHLVETSSEIVKENLTKISIEIFGMSCLVTCRKIADK